MTGDVVVETGAYDGPGPGPMNYVGFYLATGTIPVGWRSFLHYIQSQKDDLGPAVSKSSEYRRPKQSYTAGAVSAGRLLGPQ